MFRSQGYTERDEEVVSWNVASTAGVHAVMLGKEEVLLRGLGKQPEKPKQYARVWQIVD